MKSIAIHVEKGGVGKTTTAVHLAFELSKVGKTVIVDLDPQGNSTAWLVREEMTSDLGDVLSGVASIEATLKEIRPNLYILPTFAIGSVLKRWGESELFQKPNSFKKLRKVIEDMGFDFCVFDMSPGISQLERMALISTDEIIGVVKAETFSFDGLEIFEAEITKMRSDMDLTAEVSKLVLNQVNKSFKVHQVYSERLGTLNYKLFAVPQSTKIVESVVYNQVIQEFDPTNKAAVVYAELAQAVTSRQPSLLGV